MKLLASVLLFTVFFINESKYFLQNFISVSKFLLYFILDVADMKCSTCPLGDDVCDAKKSNFKTKVCAVFLFKCLS